MSEKRTIGVVLDSDFEYGVAVYEGIRCAADKIPGWSLVPVPQSQQGLLTRLSENGRLDGVIAPVISDRWVEELKAKVPVVINISNISRIESIPSVVCDDFAAGELAGRHLEALGVQGAGVIYERSIYASLRRRDGFLSYMRANGVPVDEPGFEGFYSYESDWQAWLSTLRGDIAIFGTSDRVACRFMKLYHSLERELDVRVSAVVGVGDSLAERTLSGLDLSSVVLPCGRIGIESVEVLRRAFEAKLEPGQVVIAPSEVKVRGSSAASGRSDGIVVRAQGFIERTIADRFTVGDVARHVGASRRKLEMRFRSELGISPAEYIRDKRMKLAERLLRESSLTVRDVAARCGAGSLQAFTTQFKVCHGVPPAEFRRIG